MTSKDQQESRAVIKFCCELGKTPTQTLEMINRSSVKSSVSRSLVFRWHKRFSEGHESLENEERSGRPSTIDATLIQNVKDVVYADRRVTIRDICDETGYSFGTVHRVLTNNLNMHKVSARWVPRLLSDDNKVRRVAASRKFLRRYDREGDEFLSRIVTTDETWLFMYDPETKEQSKQWKTPSSPPPKKARVTKSAGKQMYIFFADIQGMILQHAVPTGMTVNARYYSRVFICFIYTFCIVLLSHNFKILIHLITLPLCAGNLRAMPNHGDVPYYGFRFFAKI